MSAIAELPAEPKPIVGGKIKFTPETARYFSAKAAEARRANRAKPKVTPSELPAIPPQHSEELDLVLEQITRTRDVLNDDNYRYCEHCKRSGVEPHHRAQLIRALDALLDRKRILRSQPLPGSLRPTAKQHRAIAPDLPQEME